MFKELLKIDKLIVIYIKIYPACNLHVIELSKSTRRNQLHVYKSIEN